MKSECQQDETINSAIKRDQPKPRRSKDRVKVSLLILFCHVQLSFFNAGSWQSSALRTIGVVHYYIFNYVFCYVTIVFCYVTIVFCYVMLR